VIFSIYEIIFGLGFNMISVVCLSFMDDGYEESISPISLKPMMLMMLAENRTKINTTHSIR